MTAGDSAGGLDAHVRVRREHFAVDVALRVAPGETVAVMGPSGAGKSTLVGALAGLVPLESGEISIGGRVVERTIGPRTIGPEAGRARENARASAGSPRPARVSVPPMRRGVVLLGQDARLFPHLTARENVAFGPRAAGVARGRARADADAWLDRVGLPGTGARRTAELSGGEQQRVAVARALAASPRVVLLDEPLVALDPETASGIRAMLREQLHGVTTVAVTHDAVDAVSLAERLLVIERGALTQAGPVRDVLAAPASRFVAAVAGVNRIVGRVVGGVWEGEGMRLAAADAQSRAVAAVDGAPVAAVFRPGDVRVLGAGESRDANTWRARVRTLEPTPAGVRVQTGACAVDLPVAALVDIGTELVLRVDPADVRFVAAPPTPA